MATNPAPPTGVSFVGWAYVVNGQVVLQQTPDWFALPFAGATVTPQGGGTPGTVAWNGLFVADAPPPGNRFTVSGNAPLTGNPLSQSVAVPAPSGTTGAIAGYVVKSGGTLAVGSTPAEVADLIYCREVTLDGVPLLPCDDGFFLFRDVASGSHALVVTVTFAGKARTATATLTVTAGETTLVAAAQTSETNSDVLAIWYFVTGYYGIPSDFEIGYALVNADGEAPAVGEVSSHLTGTPYPFDQTSTQPNGYWEVGSADDAALTATGLGQVVSGSQLYGTPPAVTILPPCNILVDPTPIVIGRPAHVTWPRVAGSALDGVGFKAQLSDTRYGVPTLTLYPAPRWTTLPVYQPFNQFLLTAAQTAQLTDDRPWYLRIESSDHGWPGSRRQRMASLEPMAAVQPGNVPTPDPTLVQGTLPIISGCVDGWLYFADPISQATGVSDTIVFSPQKDDVHVPVTGATVTLDGGQSQTSSRRGHVHFTTSAGAHTVHVSGTNPGTGGAISASLPVTFVDSWSSAETWGTFVGYLCYDAGVVHLSPTPGVGTPWYAGRVMFDYDAAQTEALKNVLPDSDGSVEARLPAGTYALRIEGVHTGYMRHASVNVIIESGATISATLTETAQEAVSTLHILGAQLVSLGGFDVLAMHLVKAVDPNGVFLNLSSAWDPGPMMTFSNPTEPPEPYRRIARHALLLSATDGAVDHTVNAGKTLTSASGTFTDAMVYTMVRLSGGTNIKTNWYQIASRVDAHTVTLYVSPLTNPALNGSGATIQVGGVSGGDREWQAQPNVLTPGRWGLDASTLLTGHFEVWPSGAEFDQGSPLITTGTYNWDHTPAQMRIAGWIRTYPNPLVAGKPGIVYWGPTDQPTNLFRFSARAARFPQDKKPLGDSIYDLTPFGRSRVRVLTAAETTTLLDPTDTNATTGRPYALCVTACDHEFFNAQYQQAICWKIIQEALS